MAGPVHFASLLLCFCALSACASEAEPAAAPAPVVEEAGPQHQASDYVTCLQPLGDHDPVLLASAERGIVHLYGFTTRILEARPLPSAAYYPPRDRYRAERLLDHLARAVLPGSGCKFVVGFTAVDISTTKGPYPDWGVFGLGTIGGPAAVVSTTRLIGRSETATWDRLVGERTVKVVNHELGHVIGVGHQQGEGCLMNDAKGTIATVDSEHGMLCEHERRAMERLLGAELPRLERFDWETVLGP